MQGNTVLKLIKIWSVLFNFQRVERFEEESDVFREVRRGIRYSKNCQEFRITEFLEENSVTFDEFVRGEGSLRGKFLRKMFAIKLTEHVVHLVKSILKQERSFKKFAWMLRDVLRQINEFSSNEISNHYHRKKSMTSITVS